MVLHGAVHPIPSRAVLLRSFLRTPLSWSDQDHRCDGNATDSNNCTGNPRSEANRSTIPSVEGFGVMSVVPVEIIQVMAQLVASRCLTCLTTVGLNRSEGRGYRG